MYLLTINYTMVLVVMLFVVLISIQFTLNKILLLLKDIREILINNRIRDDYNERTRKY